MRDSRLVKGKSYVGIAPLHLFLLFAFLTLSVAAAAAEAPPAAPPHLLYCVVIDSVHLDSSGSLIKDPPLPPGARAVGRLTSFVVDPETGIVRLPGLATSPGSRFRGATQTCRRSS